MQGNQVVAQTCDCGMKMDSLIMARRLIHCAAVVNSLEFMSLGLARAFYNHVIQMCSVLPIHFLWEIFGDLSQRFRHWK